MKFTFKKSIVAVLVMVGLSCLQANAQLGNANTVVSSGVRESFAAITNNTSCTLTNVIGTSGATSACFAFKGELSGAGTTANTITIQQSVDRVNWATLTAFPVTPAGATAVTVVTNLNIGAIPYLRVSSIANANANTGYITNYTVKVFIK